MPLLEHLKMACHIKEVQTTGTNRSTRDDQSRKSGSVKYVDKIYKMPTNAVGISLQFIVLAFCLPVFLPSCTVPCRIVLASRADLDSCPNHLNLGFLDVALGPMACLNASDCIVDYLSFV